MTILQAVGEDSDFTATGGLTVQTTAGLFRAGYGRCALRMPTTPSSTIAESDVFSAGPVTSCWLTARIRFGGFTTTILRKLIGLGRSGTTQHLSLAVNTQTGRLRLVRGTSGANSGDTLLQEETGNSIAALTLHKLDIELVSFGASATVRVYVDGASSPVINFTGNVIPSSITNVDMVTLYAGGDNFATVQSADISEIAVSDQDTRSLSLVTLSPSGAGDNGAWSGSFADVDETTLNDADAIGSSVVGNESNFALSDLPAGSFSVRAVRVSARASSFGGAAPTSIAVGMRSGGTTSVGAAESPGIAWTPVARIMQTNPITSANFTLAEVDALQSAVVAAA